MKLFLCSIKGGSVVRIPVEDFNDDRVCKLQAGRGKLGIQFQGTFKSLSRQRYIVLEGEESIRQIVLIACLMICRWRCTIDQCLWFGLECPPDRAAEPS